MLAVAAERVVYPMTCDHATAASQSTSVACDGASPRQAADTATPIPVTFGSNMMRRRVGKNWE
jgi:hypothetical protein